MQKPHRIILPALLSRYGSIRIPAPFRRGQTATVIAAMDTSIDSVEPVRNSGLPSDTLILLGNAHRLADPEPLAAMVRAVEG